MIAAMGKDNRVIWKDWDMAWGRSYPADLKHFKKLTTGKTIVMGRKTFESLGSKPLPNRENIVITTRDDLSNVLTYPSVEACIKDLENKKDKDEEIMIIWWASIYEQFLPYSDKLYLTLINKHYEWDTFFPMFEDQFMMTSKVKMEENKDLEFTEFKREKPI